MHIHGGGAYSGGAYPDAASALQSGQSNGFQQSQRLRPQNGEGQERDGPRRVRPNRQTDETQSAAAQKPSQDFAVGASVDTRSRLVVQTAEGDRVTISLQAHSQLAAAAHSDSQGSSLAVEQSDSFQASVKVQGQLSDAEVEDIRKLLESLTSAVSQGSGTDSQDQATTQAQQPSQQELDTIAAFRYQQSQTVRAGAVFSLVG